MEQKKYKVIFSGGAIPLHDIQRVKNNLAALFRVEASRLEVLFREPLVVLKKDLSLADADDYRESVENAGGYCIIEAMGESAERSVMKLVEKTEKMACPKCHVVQPKMPICRGCGTVIQEFRDRLATTRSEVVATLQRKADETGISLHDMLADNGVPARTEPLNK